MKRLCLVALALFLMAGLEAQQLITPSGATQTGAPDFAAWGGAALQANVINGSGLSAVPGISNYQTVFHAMAAPGNAWTTDQYNGNGDYYTAGNPGPDAVWILTLENLYALSDLVFWGYHFGAANGNEAREFRLEFSADGGGSFSAPITVSLPLGGHTVAAPATLSFGGQFDADVVRLTITDNQWGGGASGGDRLGVGEFKFIGELPPRDPAIAVEPAALALTSNGSILPLTVEVANDGTANPLTISAVTAGGHDEALLTNIVFPATVAPGAREQITFEVDPAWAPAGPIEAELVISSDDRIFPSLTIPITGMIRDPWASAVSPVMHGPVPSGGPLQTISVVVENLGLNTNLQIVSAFFPDDPLGVFGVLSNFEGVLETAPGSSETLQVSFDPSGLHGGVYASTFQILLNNDPATLAVLVDVIVTVDPVEDTLVAWWPLDADSSDASGHGHDGIDFGTMEYRAAGATSRTGTAASFDGASRIEVPQHEALNRSSFTFVGWAKPTVTAGAYRSLLTSRHDRHGISSNTYGFVLYNSAGGTWEFWTGTTPGFDPWEVTSQGIADVMVDTWVHLALTYDHLTGQKNLYQDGVLVATEVVANFQPNLVKDLHLGAGGDDGAAFQYTGLLDDVAIWCEVLSEDDLRAIIDLGVAGFLNPPGPRLDLVVAELNQSIDELTVSVSNVPGGGASIFHLRSSTDGQIFTPHPGTEFTTDRTIVIRPVSPAASLLFLVQAFEGPAEP